MQSVSGNFSGATLAPLRKLKRRVAMSFLKTYNGSTSFFTIGVSSIGGSDIIKGSGSVLQEWDKYNYDDFSNRIIDISYNREFALDPNVPVILATADVTLDNHDDYFTLNNPNSPINGFMLPQRPIKIYVGFDNELVQVFVGITDGMPTFDEQSKTVTFHCIDFLYSLVNTPLDNDVIYIGQRTDQIVGNLLQFAGMSASQYVADIGTVTIPFAFFPKGSKLSDAVKFVTQAELGRLFMDENGVITFENRTNWQTNHQSIVATLSRRNAIEIQTPQTDNIINVVTVKSNARALQANQKVWELSGSQAVPPNGSVDIFADFTDKDGALPVSGVDTPVYVSSATTSSYSTNLQQDGSGAAQSTSITLSATSLFSTSYKMTFTNSSNFTIYITALQVWGTPAKVAQNIYVRQEDTTSTTKFDEKPIEIDNDYIQDPTTASTIAQIIIADQATLNTARKLKIIGIPQLQIADRVYFVDQVTTRTCYVTRIAGSYSLKGGFTQDVTVMERVINKYFTIGVSSIGGSDKIAP